MTSHTSISASAVDPRSVALRGGRDMFGLALGYLPLALTIGAAISRSPLDRLAAWFGAPVIAAGAAHLALIDLLASGGTAILAASAAVVINLRLVAYGATLAPWFAAESRRTRFLLAIFVIDPVYLLAMRRFEDDDPGPELRRWYFLGLAAVLYPMWMIGVGVGTVVGAVIPSGIELEMAAPLMMVGLLAMSVNDVPNRVVAGAGLALGFLGLGLPERSLGLVAAGLAFGGSLLWPGTASGSQGGRR